MTLRKPMRSLSATSGGAFAVSDSRTKNVGNREKRKPAREPRRGEAAKEGEAARLHIVSLGYNTISEREGGSTPPRSERKGGGSGGRARPPAPQGAELPARVRGCANHIARTGEGQPWRFWSWRRDGGGSPTRHVARCRSWRCQGECSKSLWAEDWHRIHGALEPYPVESISYLVLTLDWDGHFSRKPWADLSEAYRALSSMTRNFLASLKRLAAREGWDWHPSHWVGTVESHKSGRPHLNLLIVSRGLAAHLRAERERTGLPFPWFRGAILEAAEGAGWGRKSAGADARDVKALAGYLAKLAGGDKGAGEIAKLTQAPLASPPKTRRLRSGRGFLPPAMKNDGLTGAVVLGVDHCQRVKWMGEQQEPRAREKVTAWKARMRRAAHYLPDGPEREAARSALAILRERVPRKFWRMKLRRLQRALDALGWHVSLWPRPRETPEQHVQRLQLLRDLSEHERQAWRWQAGKTPIAVDSAGQIRAIA